MYVLIPHIRVFIWDSYLLLSLSNSVLQHVGEVQDLPLQTVVVTCKRPQSRLQSQQIHPYTCMEKEDYIYTHAYMHTAHTLTSRQTDGIHTHTHTPARFWCTAFISLSALTNASSMTLFFSASRLWTSASSWLRVRSISPSYARIWHANKNSVNKRNNDQLDE